MRRLRELRGRGRRPRRASASSAQYVPPGPLPGKDRYVDMDRSIPLVTAPPRARRPRPPTTPPDDLGRAYRGYRGTRLPPRAQITLEKHPAGAWSAGGARRFEDEEPRFYEKAQSSRGGHPSLYLADLPRGPAADARAASTTLPESRARRGRRNQRPARRVRNDDVKLERAAVQRRAVGEAILGATV